VLGSVLIFIAEAPSPLRPPIAPTFTPIYWIVGTDDVSFITFPA